jgi:ribosome recycling factor
MKIREVASITAPDTNMLIIDPWDKSIIGEIKQGLLAANAGFTPNIDGEIIRIVLPPMTSEDRERYVKMMFAKLEDGKVKIRQVRADGMHTVKKDFENKVITEDEKFAGEKKIQQFTDEFIEKIEAAGEKKKAELLQI